MNKQALLLASSSKYRQQQLAQLKIDFKFDSPDIDETPRENEMALELVVRLAEEKSKALADKYPNHLIIGADQVLAGPIVEIDKKPSHKFILGKSGNFEGALQQLMALQGKSAELISGIALYNTETENLQSTYVKHDIKYRTYTEEQIINYIHKEEPYDCAGSAKIESLGIALIESIDGNDPSAIIGLPIIQLINFLHKENFQLF